jgi:hypothetical protein
MESVLGSSLTVFLGVTVVLFGGAAWMTGRALAVTWKPWWHILPYSALLGLGARFLTYALFAGVLLAVGAYVMTTTVLCLLALLAYRLHYVHQMVRQYPWLYERHGPFAWREKPPTTPK